MRLRLFLILLGALVVLATFTFPYWQPFFTREQVQEIFPGLPTDLQDAFTALPGDQQTAYRTLLEENPNMAVEMLRAALVPPPPVSEAEQAMPTMEAELIVAEGEFVHIDAIHQGQGTATIYQMPDNSKILRFEDFTVTNGPDLRVVLSLSEEPKTPEEVELNDLDLELGRLRGTVGNQNYEIAPEVDISQYNSVVIYCRAFNVVFSTATLE
jgi:hypothetical protein